MAPTLLVVGGTGNTGRSLVHTLSERLEDSSFSSHHILVLTRSLQGATAQELAKLRHVELVEKKWTDVTPQWLRDQEVERAFIASHNNTNQFAEESSFHWAALRAGVKYVIRISTTACNVRPDNGAYYPRTHWAIEAMLSTPEYEKIQWTSLQPSLFMQYYLSSAVEVITNYRSKGKQTPLRTILNEDGPVGVIDPSEVGVFAAILLLQDDVSRHNKRKYVLSGPEDCSGSSLVKLVEDRIGVKVEDVRFKNFDIMDALVAASPNESETVLRTTQHGAEAVWNGESRASTSSKEFLELAPPKVTAVEFLAKMLQD